MEPQAPTGTRWLSYLFWGVIAFTGIGFMYFLFMPVYSLPCGGGSQSPQMQCMNNLKQLGIGFAMYCQDYDDRLPPFRDWNQKILIYVKTRDLFYCPSGGTGDSKSYYAAFASLELRPLEQIPEPAKTPLLYDSVRTKPSPYDPLLSLPVPGRHLGENIVAYADGHAKWTPDRVIREQGLKAFLQLIGETPKDPAAQGSK